MMWFLIRRLTLIRQMLRRASEQRRAAQRIREAGQ